MAILMENILRRNRLFPGLGWRDEVGNQVADTLFSDNDPSADRMDGVCDRIDVYKKQGKLPSGHTGDRFHARHCTYTVS